MVLRSDVTRFFCARPSFISVCGLIWPRKHLKNRVMGQARAHCTHFPHFSTVVEENVNGDGAQQQHTQSKIMFCRCSLLYPSSCYSLLAFLKFFFLCVVLASSSSVQPPFPTSTSAAASSPSLPPSSNRNQQTLSVVTADALRLLAKQEQPKQHLQGAHPHITTISSKLGKSKTVNVQGISTTPSSQNSIRMTSHSMSTTNSSPRTSRWRAALSLPSWRSSSSRNISKNDRDILQTALPAMANLAVVPAVTAIETMWVGRLSVTDSVALAGQSAANSAFLTSFYLVQFLPSMAAPLIATAVGQGNQPEAQKRVCETLLQSLCLGLLGTLFLVGFPQIGLRLVLPADAPALDIAVPYLRIRALSMMWELISATGVAGFRGGLLDTVTPLKISAGSRVVKLVLDPLLMRGTPLGILGAAVSTLGAEMVSGVLFWKGLIHRKLLTVRGLLCRPEWSSLKFMLTGGINMMVRQIAINVAFISSTRMAQSLDPTSGVTGAAYGIVNQIYTIGFVVHVAMQGAAAALVPSTMAKDGVEHGRRLADRLLVWGGITGCALGALQYVLLPFLIPMFTQLPDVQQAAKVPAMLACILHVANGPRFAGEGILMGLKAFRELTWITVGGVALLVAALRSPLGSTSLSGVMWANILFCSYQSLALVGHYLFVGELSTRRQQHDQKEIHLKQR